MNKDKILTGYDLVSKGATKLGATLPENGLKDIFPNGSWLEKKQIQAALEARKHLIEVERIEKSGVLSHAVWREDLMMAEVTQKVGGYWQYLGQNKGKDLFLNPEEALFLMETNCLHLTHNDVKVSMQQAYSLLLRGKITLLKYKVYASLSRLGYRVLRHQIIENGKNITTSKKVPCSKDEINENNTEQSNDFLSVDNGNHNCEIKEEQDIDNINEEIDNTPVDSVSPKNKTVKQKNTCGVKKLEKMNKRKLIPCNSEKLHEYFECVPELLNRTSVTCKVADDKFLPNELQLRKSVYFIDLKKLSCKSDQPSASESSRYSPNDEVNGSHIPRLRNISYRSSHLNLSTTGFPYQRFPRPSRFYRPHSVNFIHAMFQPNILPNMFFVPPIQFLLRPQGYIRHGYIRPPTFHNFRNRKRSRHSAQFAHLESIKNLTVRLKNLFQVGHPEQQNIEALRRLIQTYNTRYQTRLRLTDDLDLTVDEIVDTITLDDDEPAEKRPRVSDKEALFKENLNSLTEFAAKLKNLEKEGKSSARHRRSFSKLVKTFNQSYNEEYYITETFELGNKRLVTLDTSDSCNSDCVIEDIPKFPNGKKLKNPFNVLKRMSQKQTEFNEASTSSVQNDTPGENAAYSKTMLDAFSSWLPNANDFGRPEIVEKDTIDGEMLDIRQEEFLYDFMKLKPCQSNNWFDLKKSYYNSIREAIAEFQNSMDCSMDSNVNSIVKPQDCLNMGAVLRKLSIIKREKKVKEQCRLAIDFDVYNRDVQNFRKTDLPVPHFRILCLSACTNMPTGDEIAALHSKYEDNVAIIFAIVGDAVSYVQVNPIDLPVYISNVS